MCYASECHVRDSRVSVAHSMHERDIDRPRMHVCVCLCVCKCVCVCVCV
jgi:hypothetical protein